MVGESRGGTKWSVIRINSGEEPPLFVLVLIVCVELLRAERPIGGRLSIALGMVVGFGCLLKLSVAIGVGMIDALDTAETVMERADEAMYARKAAA